MGTKKPGLTKEEHAKLDQELFEIHQRLGDILIQLRKADPHTTYEYADKAYEAVDMLRDELDSRVLVDQSDE